MVIAKMTLNVSSKTKIAKPDDVKMILGDSKAVARVEHLPLRLIRERKSISQRVLAKKMGIKRGQLLRIERKPWDKLALGELDLFSTALDLNVRDLIHFIAALKKKEIYYRGDRENPFFEIELDCGIHCASFLPKPKDHFVGILSIPPQKCLKNGRIPRSDFLMVYIVKGVLNLSLQDRDLVLREGQYFSYAESLHIEFYNPQRLDNLEILLITTPSFVQIH